MIELGSHHEAKGGSNRGFGIVFAVVFVIVALWPLMNGGAVRLWSLAIAAVFLALAFFAPAVLEKPNWLWTKFGLLLGAIVAPLVMILVFFVAVTPMALIMRLTGYDPLRRKTDPDAETYWIERDMPVGPMKNQF